jgi:hypothetical protein
LLDAQAPAHPKPKEVALWIFAPALIETDGVFRYPGCRDKNAAPDDA